MFKLPPDEMELGLGVHGEPGIARMKTTKAHEVVDKMLKHMTNPSSDTSMQLKEGKLSRLWWLPTG